MANKNKRNDVTLPSRSTTDRELVLATLRTVGVPMTRQELAERIRERQPDAVELAVQSLVRAGDVLVNRKGELLVAEKLDLVRGTLQGHPDGFGFLVPDQGGDDLFL